MKLFHTTGPVLAALLVTSCGAHSQHASAPERAAQRAQEDKQEAQKEARAAQQDAEKARQQAQEAARAEREAEWNAQMASQREAQAQWQTAHDTRAQEVPRAGVTERQADPKGAKVVLFAVDSAELSANTKTKLDGVSMTMRAEPKATDVIVEGYTDDTGTEANNVQLSRKRADAVADYLANHGVARERITTKAMGSHHPAKAGTGEAPALKRTLNRRVEVVIRPPGTP
jgi:outer membrane protein OmpA-like peptidoglycan-associated protein